MFRVATANDYLPLRKRYRSQLEKSPHDWGLKTLGRLFCRAQMGSHATDRVLEVGSGLNRYLHRYRPAETDYWMIDKAGFYNAERYREALARSADATIIDGMLGDGHPELPADHFDMSFSVSVLEHVPDDDIDRVCDDMFRVTKPGGCAVHSLDCAVTDGSRVAERWYGSMVRAGFVPEDEQQVDLRVRYVTESGRAAFLEPLQIEFECYGGVTDPYEEIRPISVHYTALLAVMQKPA